MKKQLITGIVAHVDAGKTTLSESLLYTSGTIRKLGKVDTKDAFLDTNVMERARGITIFSKQAQLLWNDTTITLLDTPGHVDFSAEMERTLGVLDYAILIISGADGVQGHTQTLWELLMRYDVPVFLFVNKMDQPGTNREKLMAELKIRLDGSCVDFTDVTPRADVSDAQKDSLLTMPLSCPEEILEDIASCDEKTMESYFETGELQIDQVRRLIWERKLFPCYFGSALKIIGIESFLDGFCTFTLRKIYPEEFGAKVFKITRDVSGNRLTHLKLTGGTLRPKMTLTNRTSLDEAKASAKSGTDSVGSTQMTVWEEKINQIRVYNGDKFETPQEIHAGEICALTGLNYTYPGQGLGKEAQGATPLLEPVLSRQIILPEGTDAGVMLPKLRLLEEEQPELHIVWDERLQEIDVQVMGEVQMEILSTLIHDRFGTEVSFGQPHIVYKETILDTVEGVGHFEPLRHYAEVHLLMEPLPAGSGLIFTTDCSEDLLDKNWQRLILTHLGEKMHRGVLTGSAITDMKITVIAGRAHQKHTEGGDFRKATYRAVRQGLMEAESRLLEPFYNFRLEIPETQVGRAMSDIEKMNGHFDAPQIADGLCVLTGYAPVVTMQDYKQEVSAYTKGFGRLSFSFRGYEACHNEDDVIKQMAYDPEGDVRNSPDSVFCAHGAGFVVPWYEVKTYMHVESPLSQKQAPTLQEQADEAKRQARSVSDVWIGTEEVDAILAQAGHANEGAKKGGRKGIRKKTKEKSAASIRKSFDADTAASTRESFDADTAASTRNFDADTEAPTRKNIDTDTVTVAARENAASKDSPQQDKWAQRKAKETVKKEEYLLVDGYNIIFAWKELADLAKINMDAARGKLLDELCNYQGSKQMQLIVVFDAYRVIGHKTEVFDYHNIHVVYTKEAETADQYIEKFAHTHAKKYNVTVATSDGLEQIIIRGEGCRLLSAMDLKEEMERTMQQLREKYQL